MGKQTYGLIMQYIPPLAQQWASQRAFRKCKANNPEFLPISNVNISNVPGPSEKLQAGENTVEDFYSTGPIIEGMGLNITIWSYAGNLNFSFLGCKKALPDMHKLSDGIADAMEELQQTSWLPDNMDG